MTAPYDAEAAARWMAEQHRSRKPYANLPAEHTPPTIADAYRAQDAIHRLWEATRGPIAGRKIATTTKVMQQLMGIDHPCGGAILANSVHTSPARIARAGFMNVVLECELAVRVARDLDASGAGGAPWTRASVRGAIADLMPAFELIEDRNAVYRETKATTLIVDNAWNGGIVLGKPVPLASTTLPDDLNGIIGRMRINGGEAKQGRTDDPLGALAWVANLAIERGRPLMAGQVVITGSLIPTFKAEPGDHVTFEIDGLGAVELEMV